MQPPNKIYPMNGFSGSQKFRHSSNQNRTDWMWKGTLRPEGFKVLELSRCILFSLDLSALWTRLTFARISAGATCMIISLFWLIVLLWILLHCVTLVSSLSFGCIRCGSCESQLLLFPHPSLVKTFLWKVRSIQTHFSLGFIWKRPTAIQSSHHRELKEGHVSGLKQKKGERTFKNQIGFWL